jgi:5-methylcytosine-specific restriction endonuclease McrA
MLKQPDLLFPKPSTKAVKAGQRKHRADIIRAVRLQVMQRDTSCRVCGSTNGAEMHELRPRSLMRGQPPEDIYTLTNCLRLCSRCHGQVTRHELLLVAVTIARGADGRVQAQRVLRSRHVLPTIPAGPSGLEG